VSTVELEDEEMIEVAEPRPEAADVDPDASARPGTAVRNAVKLRRSDHLPRRI